MPVVVAAVQLVRRELAVLEARAAVEATAQELLILAAVVAVVVVQLARAAPALLF